MSHLIMGSTKLHDTHIQVHIERLERDLADKFWLHVDLNRD